jgi:hypothetical protein
LRRRLPWQRQERNRQEAASNIEHKNEA